MINTSKIFKTKQRNKNNNQSSITKKASVFAILTVLLMASFVSFANAETTTWNTEIVDLTISSPTVWNGWGFTSIAVDSNDNPHISYYDAINQDLMYAKWDGSSWIIETVDSTGIVGEMSAIAVDSNDNPHISYMATFGLDNDLKYAKWDGSSWIIQTVDSTGATGSFTSIAVDSNDNPHISYHVWTPYYALMYAKWDGSSWIIQTVDSNGNAGRDCSLALDSADKPHITYFSYSNTGSRIVVVLKYATVIGSTWAIETLDEVVNVPWISPDLSIISSIAVDSNDNPHISYYNRQNDELKYANWNGISWNIEVLASHSGAFSSIALDSNDNPHIIYTDFTINYLQYVNWNGETWNTQSIDNECAGQFNFLAIDSNDKLYASYFDNINYNLKFSTTANIRDSIPPTIELVSPVEYDLYATDLGVSYDFSATDNLDLDPEVIATVSDILGKEFYVQSGDLLPTESGVYTLSITATDDAGLISTLTATFVVYDAEAGFVTGGGWIDSPEGAYSTDSSLADKATFGFVSKYKKGADTPIGQTQFKFHVADLNFHSTDYDWLVVAGAKAQYKGTGTINGEGEYGFMLTVTDGEIKGDGIDTFRIKIWDKTTDTIIYDNQLDAPDTEDPTTVIGGGSIVIHK